MSKSTKKKTSKKTAKTSKAKTTSKKPAAKEPATKKRAAKKPAEKKTSSDTIEKHMEKRFAKIRDERRLPPKVLLELEAKIREHDVSKKEFDEICDNVIASYEMSLVEPGEAVGTVAAQSIGE
ncbi:MAG: hypothetical protein ACFFD6_11545, partial [Candidatus Thorarchaeota archaeon]